MMLEGVRVLDFGWVWAGALPGQLLAFLGAEVIKVESMARLDSMRMGLPLVGDKLDPEQQPMFHNVNRGKRSLSIDIQSPKARDLLLDLVGHCDVAIENFTPGVIARAGLSYDDLRARRPDLVMLSLSGGGQTGALRDFRSYAATIAAYCGLDVLSGYPHEEPLGIQQAYGDPNASVFGAVGLVAALVRQRRTGRGDYIDLAQLEAGLATVGEAVAAEALMAGFETPLGNQPTAGEIIHECFSCHGEDEWVAVVVESDTQLVQLRTLLQVHDSSLQEVRSELVKWCATRGHVQAMEELQHVGVPAGAVTSAEDRFANPHFASRGVYKETEHPVIGWELVYDVPWKFVGGPDVAVRAAPMMGEANEYLVCGLLGHSHEYLASLIDEGVLR
jgi:benzylsuccinate CoA-transferase BbsF subunit